VLAAPRESASAVDTAAGYFTAGQLAEFLQVDVTTIYRMASREASMPTLRLGGVVRFPRAKVLAWLEAHEQGQAKPRRKTVDVAA
jgi:excisionase family DNA binding protein